ncbi:class I SAM-dependent methyltransferase [Gordonia crocea]|uniref:Methyltransferase n=1 Tax=Gordonia crocea TaxID=589162 RepID=A0A7I9V2T2_9ACTN|nr:class I SAM-dependent methyltransferase [Gordonia crocea]GED99340.1 methyltransferase [Gordonia crocea]
MHQHDGPARPVDPREHWEEFYGDGKRPWTRRPNAILVEEVGALPGAGRTALDLGCGSGADAIWLAQQGYAVTAVDIADAALETGRAHAREAGVPDEAIDWRRVDLGADFPVGSWDLVTAFYLHSNVELARADILRKAAGAVAPGGTLLVVGHWGMPEWRFDGDPPSFPSVDDVLADLDLSPGWAVVTTGLREVAMTDPEGNPAARTDNLVRVTRPA